MIAFTVASTLAAEAGTAINAAASSKLGRIMRVGSLLFGKRGGQPVRPKRLPEIVNPAMLHGEAKRRIMHAGSRSWRVGLDYKELPRDVGPGAVLLLDDGLIRLMVEPVEGSYWESTERQTYVYRLIDHAANG